MSDDRKLKKALEKAGEDAVKAFQKEVLKSSWNKTPTRLLQSFTFEVNGETLTVSSDHPAAKYLNEDVKPHQMIYLQKAKRPIPIITEQGDVIFRQPSSKSMSRGGWRHPGISGKHFLDRGKEAAQKVVEDAVSKVYQDKLDSILKKK